MTFRERYMEGLTDFDEIFDLTSKWNYSDETCTLREYLGLNAEEEDIWISESDEALEDYMEQEKAQRIFFFDLDDTLFNKDKVITPDTKKALDKALKAGHLIAINTGRAFVSAQATAKRIGLDRKGCYIVCFNGGEIHDAYTGENLVSHSVSLPLVRKCFDLAKDFGIHFHTYGPELVISEADTEDLRIYDGKVNMECQVVDDAIAALEGREPAKMLAIDFAHQERIAPFREMMEKAVGDELDMFTSDPHLLEIVPKGVNKGAAIHYLCDFLGIPVSHSIAVGDGENDIAMIREAGVGCAMSNAMQPLKDAADFVTSKDCNHDGCVEVLEKFGNL